MCKDDLIVFDEFGIVFDDEKAKILKQDLIKVREDLKDSGIEQTNHSIVIQKRS